jgi:hypothetical protein
MSGIRTNRTGKGNKSMFLTPDTVELQRRIFALIYVADKGWIKGKPETWEKDFQNIRTKTSEHSNIQRTV